jgi:DNA invertase Pin-like site-specific DNA recombinase
VTERRDVEYVVVYMRSRAFRNALDALTTKHQLKKLGVKLVSAKEDFGDGIWATAVLRSLIMWWVRRPWRLLWPRSVARLG